MSGHFELSDGRRVDLRDGMSIGRVATNDLQIDDAKASRRHAKLHLQGGVLEVEDLGSSNGTTLNGSAVTRRVVRDGDVIGIGRTRLTYREGVAVGPASGDPLAGEDLFADELAAPPEPAAPAPPPVEPVARPAAAEPAAARPTAETPPPVDDLNSNDLMSNDLLDDDFVDAPVAAPVQPSAPPPPQPPPAPSRPSAKQPAPKQPAPKQPAPSRPAEDLDFDDEVVVTAKPVRPTTPEGKDAGGLREAANAAARSQHGVLQFSSQRRSAGALAQDVSQAGGMSKVVMVVIGLAVAAAVAFGAMQLAKG